MNALRLAVLIAVLATAALMVLPGTSLLTSAHPNIASTPAGGPTPLAAAALPTGSAGSASAAPRVASNPLQAADLRAQAALTAAGVPRTEQLLPTFAPSATVQNGMITPGSALAAVPVGIADYGISDRSGHNVAAVTYTPKVAGVLTLNSMQLLYADSYGPDEFTTQLNSVATGVTVQGDSNLQFWFQNVIYYYGSSHTMHLASAIVNFTGTSFNFPSNTLLSWGNGSIDPGFGYFNPDGGAIYAPEPFTLGLYMNLTVANGHPAVLFNYSVASPAGHEWGEFDRVVFNGSVAQSPAFQIDGKGLGATGYIPNDVELILGGDGGGSTTSALNLGGTMNLYIQPNGTTTPREVPAAYDFGGETGETMEGVAEYASGGANPTVHFSAGPGVQRPLWGVVGAPAFGDAPITLDLAPANAFVFASIGPRFDANVADWAFVPPSGTRTFNLPAGSYSFEFLLSDYKPVTRNNVTAGTLTVALRADASEGIYTPLWVYGNSEFAAISSGNGTTADPYELVNAPVEPLNPLFGQYNDYMFPIFPGIQIADTTVPALVGDEPSFEVPFTLASETFYNGVLPLSNELGWFLYNASHVSLLDNLAVGGWVNYAVYGGASLILWNSSHDLIGANQLPVASVGIIEYGGSSNTIWGNVFTESLPAALDDGYILDYGHPSALYLYESGDLVYNNYFGTPGTAFTPAYNVYEFNYVPTLWTDRWNVPMQPASDGRVVNGFLLSGSILGLSYEGGNYWSNYGTQSDPFGVLPYNDGQGIDSGGDHVPLEAFALFEVSFSETGLHSGKKWSVTLNGITESSSSSTINFWDPNGTYAYTVATVTGAAPTPSPSLGAVAVNGAAQSVGITFS
jgi:thermopsin